MKKMLFLICALASGTALATIEPAPIPALQPKGEAYTVWTEGPDYYRDGTPVLDGERYAFVHVADGHDFGGFFMDGSLADPVNNKLITKELFARGGRCPLQAAIQINEGVIEKPGSFYLLALDTRTPDGTPGRLVNGATLVSAKNGNGSGIPAATVSRVNPSMAAGFKTLTASGSGGCYTSLPNPGDPPPKITGIEIRDGKAFITAEIYGNMWHALTASPKAGEAFSLLKSQPLDGGKGKEATFSCELFDADSGFFRVVGGTLEAVTVKGKE